MSEAFLAVVVLNWNGREDTLHCLASLAKAEAPSGIPLRVYMPDNGSEDGSVPAVRAAFPETVIVENGANLGYSGGNNRGWRAAARDGADVICFLNNDAVVAPDALRRMYDVLMTDAGLGVVSPRIFRGRGPEDGQEDVWFEKGSVTLDRFVVAVHSEASEAERAAAVYETDCACGCALMVRTSHLETVGGFDEGFFAYYEDVDLSLKLRALGLRCGVAPQAHAWHRVSASTGGSLSPTATFYTFRNGRLLARRHAPRPQAWLRYRRGWVRQWLSQAKWVSQSAAVASGAAALQGGLCGLLGQRGPRPKGLPEAPFRWLAARLAALP